MSEEPEWWCVACSHCMGEGICRTTGPDAIAVSVCARSMAPLVRALSASMVRRAYPVSFLLGHCISQGGVLFEVMSVEVVQVEDGQVGFE